MTKTDYTLDIDRTHTYITNGFETVGAPLTSRNEKGELTADNALKFIKEILERDTKHSYHYQNGIVYKQEIIEEESIKL